MTDQKQALIVLVAGILLAMLIGFSTMFVAHHVNAKRVSFCLDNELEADDCARYWSGK